MAAIEWGVDDCLIDIFGADAHKNISWVRENHNDTLAFVLTMSETERWDLMRATAEGQGFIRVDKARPGDAAIAHFKMSVIVDYDLLTPWFAQMGNDHLWYVRLPKCLRVVDYTGDIEVYRCPLLP